LARPKKVRHVENLPYVSYFKPAGIPLKSLEEVTLAVEEIEALRLKDLEGLDQADAAARMNVSRPTFQRILVKARGKVAEALFHGKAVRIGGGDFHVAPDAPAGRGKCREDEDAGPRGTKIAVPTDGDDLTAEVGEKFGRCLRFLIVDGVKGVTDKIDNATSIGDHNAGIKSAKLVIDYGVDAILAGRCGPKALKLLEAAGIEVVTDVTGKIADAVAAYQAES
jgi:uncharacterized protein